MSFPRRRIGFPRSLKEISENLKSEGVEIEWGRYTSENSVRVTLRLSQPEAMAEPTETKPGGTEEPDKIDRKEDISAE